MNLRSFMDRIAPHFEANGRLAPIYPLFEAIDTALYTPGSVTAGPSHVRDGLDLKRIMMTVWLCAFIPAFAGCSDHRLGETLYTAPAIARVPSHHGHR